MYFTQKLKNGPSIKALQIGRIEKISFLSYKNFSFITINGVRKIEV
jgi:hypothetical protein